LRNIDAARIRVIHAQESNQQAEEVYNSNILRDVNYGGVLLGSPEDARGLGGGNVVPICWSGADAVVGYVWAMMRVKKRVMTIRTRGMRMICGERGGVSVRRDLVRDQRRKRYVISAR
jgi:hypothetical protein